MTLRVLRDLRREQGVRVANASRVLLYLQIEQEIAALERRQEPRP